MQNNEFIIKDKYKIIREIGRGGMGTVYLAKNLINNQAFAVKKLRKETNKNCCNVKNEKIIEVEVLKKISHPYLPSIEEVIETEDDFFIVMEYIRGKNLEELIKENGKLTYQEMLKIVNQLTDVLTFLHSQNPPIIYRDLKPSNVMVQNDGEIKLIDFGTAREYNEFKTEDTVLMGTRGYAAPEQLVGVGQSDARTDIYSLGVLIYYILTGEDPLTINFDINREKKSMDELPVRFKLIIMKCTCLNPIDRYQSMRDLKNSINCENIFSLITINKTIILKMFMFLSIVLISIIEKSETIKAMGIFMLMVNLSLGYIMDIKKKYGLTYVNNGKTLFLTQKEKQSVQHTIVNNRVTIN